MQPFSQPQPRRQVQQYSGLPSVLVACAVQDNALICVEKGPYMRSERRIFEHPFSESSNGCRSIIVCHEKLGFVERSVKETTKAMVIIKDGQLILILCTMKGDVLKYARKS